MDHKEFRHFRLLLLGLFLLAVMGLYTGVLYDVQVTHHEEYLASSVRSIARVEKVTASRGIITDRNGRTLVSNSSAYNLTFDKSLLKAGENENEAILRLLELCESRNVEWADSLPMSKTAPYAYQFPAATQAQRSSFLKYVLSLKDAKAALGDYLLLHPEALGEAAPAFDGEASDSERRTALLEALDVEHFTATLLISAGLEAGHLLDLMRKSHGIDESWSQGDARKVLGVQYELARRNLGTNTAYVLAEPIDTEFISILSDGNYAGAKISSSYLRQYETPYAAHILGTVSRYQADDKEALAGKGYDGDDWIGRSGVEAAFEDYLRGTDGKRVVSTNEGGKTTGVYYSTEPQPGSTVELTIDLDLQSAVENALAQAVTSMNDKDGRDDRGAGAAVIKVGTGEVLALASYPTFNLSTYRQDITQLNADPARPEFNRATYGTYAPGSTLKPLTAVAALEIPNITTLAEQITDTGRWSYPGDPNSGAKCWIYPGRHGKINVVEAITVSCNYFFAEMGYRMGMDKLVEYLTAFGLGEPTGIEIGENTGTLPENRAGENQAPWAAFGQANQLYTPLQLANYIATLVSGGKHCEAHLLKAVKAYDNSDILLLGDTTPVNTVSISDSTLKAVKQGMHNLTTTSLARYFSNCVVDAGAKTGTAQVFSGDKNNGVFVCFAPYEEPEIALAIVIEKGDSGSALASTAVEILNAYFTADNIGMTIVGENQLRP